MFKHIADAIFMQVSYQLWISGHPLPMPSPRQMFKDWIVSDMIMDLVECDLIQPPPHSMIN